MVSCLILKPMIVRRFIFTVFAGITGLFAAQDTPTIVPNIALLDHQGRSHELDYYCRMPDTKGIVLFIQGNGCPLVQKRIPELKRLREDYEKQGILFCMLNSNLQDTRDEINAEAESFGIDFPILIDDSQAVAHVLGLTRTAEALLINTKNRQLVYRGGIDDRLTYQKEKPEATEHYLKDAIGALLEGSAPKIASTEAPGCKITLAAPKEGLSFSEHIAPILKSRCVSCHTKGGIGPFAMSNYKKVKGWSEMMEEVLITRQMPPWHADPHIGKFAKDQGITPDEKQTLLAWLRQGAERGDGDDPLVGYAPEKVEWHLGTPDHIMELPAQEVPAEGVVDYRYVKLETPFDEDTWLRGMEVNPGNERVLHHVVVTGYPKEQQGKRKDEKWFTGYAPGTAAWPAPEGTGIKLPKGYILKFQLHYTTNGKPETDATKMGLYLAKGKVKKELHTRAIVHARFKIPPHAMEHSESYERTLKHDVTLYAMNPHMHYRGKRMSFHAKLADGTARDLLSVPNYNFNWQRTYVLEEPMQLPKGTKLAIRNAWDNSSLNPHNPDPNITVTWGEQTFQEMFFATYQYTIDD
ncbi:MAG: hypothetical protein ACI8T1_004107 [Verrucomicrobiales bacterium]